MSVPFSEDLWQRLSGLWRRDKKEEEEAVGYDDPQLKQMLDVMMVSRRSMKAAEKQKYDIDRAWRRVEKQTAGGWRVPGWCRYAAAVTVLFFSVWGWVTYNREVRTSGYGRIDGCYSTGRFESRIDIGEWGKNYPGNSDRNSGYRGIRGKDYQRYVRGRAEI